MKSSYLRFISCKVMLLNRCDRFMLGVGELVGDCAEYEDGAVFVSFISLVDSFSKTSSFHLTFFLVFFGVVASSLDE